MIWATLLGTAAAPMVAGVAGNRQQRSERLSARCWMSLAAGCILAVAAAALVEPFAATVVYAAALLAIVAAAAVDAVEQRLPNVLTLGSCGFALVGLTVISILTGTGSPWRALAGGAIFGGWILLGAFFVRDGYGLGDVKLAAACGILAGWLSWQTLAVDVLITQITIALVLLHAKARGRQRVALGPALVAGLLVAILTS